MTGWNSLSGYLVLRPSGALGRLKSRKKQWFVFDEIRCELLLYRNEDEAKTKAPIKTIDIKKAAITISTENPNEFTILADKKDYILVADTHESMMIWVRTLQAKRDASLRQRQGFIHNDYVPNKLADLQRRRESLPSNQEVQSIIERAMSAEDKLQFQRTHSLRLPSKNPLAANRYKRSVSFFELMRKNLGESNNHHSPVVGTGAALSTPDESGDYDDTTSETPVCPAENLTDYRSSETAIAESWCGVANVTDNKDDFAGSFVEDGSGSCFQYHQQCLEVDSSQKSHGGPMSLDCSLVQSRDSMFSNGDLSPKLSGDDLQEFFCDDNLCSTICESCGKDNGHANLCNKNSATSDAGHQERTSLLRRMNSDSSVTGSCLEKQERTWSISSQSASCDSAIGHGECTHSLRLHELESELMTTKCELARVLNRLSTYKYQLEEQVEFANDLQNQIQQLKDANNSRPSKELVSAEASKFQEKCRFLQNQNRFLNDEVLKLSCILQRQQHEFEGEQVRRLELESRMDRLKRDYISLLQSTIRIMCKEESEDVETDIQGSSRHHTSRVLELLEEARKVNPALPAYDSSCHRVCHVDSLGFKHTYDDEGLSMHYVCRQLYHHYSVQLNTYHEHVQQWKAFLKNATGEVQSPKKLKSLVRAGIPSNLRSRVWRALFRSRIHGIVEEKGPNYYSSLCSMAPNSEIVAQHRRQISLDLLRTMPNNVHFNEQESEGTQKLQEVLQAFCLHNPSIGYCQGMNFLVGLFLLFMDAEDAFWCLVAITEKYFSANYFDHCLAGAQADQAVLEELTREKLPRLHKHLSKHGIQLATVTINWFLAVFFDAVPLETLLRIWDCFLLDGPKVLFRFSLAIMKLQEDAILSKDNVVAILRQIKSSARLCYDADTLIKVAFEELKPFPRRQDIAAKEAYYYKTLRETARRHEKTQDAIRTKSNLLLSQEAPEDLAFQCATAYGEDQLWLCYRTVQGSRISQASSESGTMFRVGIELNNRVTCLHALNDRVVLVGTLAQFVHAYSTADKPKLLWEARVHDSVLSLCSVSENDMAKIFAGLANGTVAAIENFESSASSLDISYVMIGCSTITCLCFLEQQLWCACGNKVFVVNAKTLDILDQFQVSTTGFDYISNLVPNDYGMWITIHGSYVLQLWDQKSFTCKLMYDTKNNTYPRHPMKADDSFIDPSRITAVLAHGDQVLAGTADGFLVVYQISVRPSCGDSIAETDHPNLSNYAEGADAEQIGKKLQELYEQQEKNEAAIKQGSESTKNTRDQSDSGCFSTPEATPVRTLSRRQSSMTIGSQNLSDVSEGCKTTRSRKHSSGHHSMEGVQLEEKIDAVLLEEDSTEIDTDKHKIGTFENSDDEGSNGEWLRKTRRTTAKDDNFHLNIHASQCCQNLNDQNDENSEYSVSQKTSKWSPGHDQIRSCGNVASNLLDKKNEYSKDTLKKLNGVFDDESTHHGEKLVSRRRRNLVSRNLSKELSDEKEETSNCVDVPETCSMIKVPYFPSVPKFRKRVSLPDIAETASFHKLKATLAMLDHANVHRNRRQSVLQASRIDSGKRRSSYSVDDIHQWLSGDNLSSLTSDSYEFDDLLVPYRDDDAVRNLAKFRADSMGLPGCYSRSYPGSSSIAYHNQKLSVRLQTNLPVSPRPDLNKSRSPSDVTMLSEINLQSGNNEVHKIIRDHFPQWSNGFLTDTDDSERPVSIEIMVSNAENTNGSEGDRSPALSQSPREDVSHSWASDDDSTTGTELDSASGLMPNRLLPYEHSSGATAKQSSDTASNISFSSDFPYALDVQLRQKIKISDKCIKCLVQVRCLPSGEPAVISCAGCYGEDEAVLKWTQDKIENLWSNDPIVEVCPVTNVVKPSPFTRARMPLKRSFSTNAIMSPDDNQTDGQLMNSSKPSRSQQKIQACHEEDGARDAASTTVKLPGSRGAYRLFKMQDILATVSNKPRSKTLKT